MRTLSLAPISGRRRPAASYMLRWAAPSVFAHALAVAAGVIEFGTQPGADENRPMHEVIFLAPLLPRQDPHQTGTAATGPGGAPVGWTNLLDVASSAGLVPGAASGRSTGTGEGTTEGPVASEDSTSSVAAPGNENVFQAVDVDREVARDADAAAPIYPEELRLSGVQGAVTVEFVVDTVGLVEKGSLHIIGTTHPMFAVAVRDAAPGMHFRPAVRAGQLVRQQVIQTFQFVLQNAVQAASNTRTRPDSVPDVR